MSLKLWPWTGLYLEDPWLLAVVVLVPVALWIRRRRGDAAICFAPGGLLGSALPRTWRTRLAALPRVLQVLAIVLGVVALARPVHRELLPRRTEGIDILLCLDVSSSMTATDLDPERTRLEVAKAAAARFIAGRPDDRIGLIRFARFPDLVCPPTLDHAALQSLLDGVVLVESDGDEDLTGIGTAVARSAQVLAGAPARSRVVILLTDGEETVATTHAPDEIAPLHAAQLCRELGVRAYAIAVGEGVRDASGRFVPVDTGEIERIARHSGGAFFAARDAAAVEGVYAAIDRLERAPLEEPRYRVEERFLPFLAAALGLLLAGGVLRLALLEVLP